MTWTSNSLCGSILCRFTLVCNRAKRSAIAPLPLRCQVSQLLSQGPAEDRGGHGQPAIQALRRCEGSQSLMAALSDQSVVQPDLPPVEIASGTALWYHSGIKPVPIRWWMAQTAAFACAWCSSASAHLYDSGQPAGSTRCRLRLRVRCLRTPGAPESLRRASLAVRLDTDPSGRLKTAGLGRTAVSTVALG